MKKALKNIIKTCNNGYYVKYGIVAVFMLYFAVETVNIINMKKENSHYLNLIKNDVDGFDENTHEILKRVEMLILRKKSFIDFYTLATPYLDILREDRLLSGENQMERIADFEKRASTTLLGSPWNKKNKPYHELAPQSKHFQKLAKKYPELRPFLLQQFENTLINVIAAKSYGVSIGCYSGKPFAPLVTKQNGIHHIYQIENGPIADHFILEIDGQEITDKYTWRPTHKGRYRLTGKLKYIEHGKAKVNRYEFNLLVT